LRKFVITTERAAQAAKVADLVERRLYIERPKPAVGCGCDLHPDVERVLESGDLAGRILAQGRPLDAWRTTCAMS